MTAPAPVPAGQDQGRSVSRQLLPSQLGPHPRGGGRVSSTVGHGCAQQRAQPAPGPADQPPGAARAVHPDDRERRRRADTPAGGLRGLVARGLADRRVRGGGQPGGPTPTAPAPSRPQLDDQLHALPETGGRVIVGDGAWAWAYPLRSIAGPIGHMIACAGCQPTGEEQFLAQVVAQQTGVAVSNARLHARERAIATELAQTNTALQETVATLSRGMQIHERLTRVAAAGRGGCGHRRGAARPDRAGGRGRGPVRQPVRLGRTGPARTVPEAVGVRAGATAPPPDDGGPVGA